MLTNAAVKAARLRTAAYKLFDQGGLHLYVAPTGRKSFRMKYRFGGKEQLLTIGAVPEVTLDAARARCDQVREQLSRGEDPRAPAADTSTAPSTFEPAARAWYAHRLADWTSIHAADVIASLERDIFPILGGTPLADIRPPLILQVLRAIERRGSIETARRLQQRISRVFKYACSEGWADANPAEGVAEAMARGRAARHHPALVDVEQLRILLDAAELVDVAPSVKLASRFLALTAVRLAAVRGARWNEIEDLDGAPTWRVPAARMKLAAAKKLDAANDHLVPLSAAAVDVLRAARRNLHSHAADLDGAALIFPGRDGGAIGEGAIRILYQRAGFGDRHVPHGWRASFSTILNEQLPDERAAIDRALGHVGGGKGEEEKDINVKVEGAYNRSTHMPRRRRLFDAWAQTLAGAAPIAEAGAAAA
jgi:integrase